MRSRHLKKQRGKHWGGSGFARKRFLDRSLNTTGTKRLFDTRGGITLLRGEQHGAFARRPHRSKQVHKVGGNLLHAAHDYAGGAGGKLVCKRASQTDRSRRGLLKTKLRKTIRIAPEQAHNQVLGLRSRRQTSHACLIEHIGQKVARHGGEQEARARSVTQRLQIGRVPGC